MKLIIIQSVPACLKAVQNSIENNLPNKFPGGIIYNSNFEDVLDLIPKEGELTVITSNFFHDSLHVKFSCAEKSGDRLAELIKEINPVAKVYVFAESEPAFTYVDGFFKKKDVDNVGGEVIDVLRELGLLEM